MADFSLFVTNAGLSMITDTAFSGTIIFTRILLGSGNTSEPPQSMSSLVQEEVSLLMSSISKDDNKVTLKTVLQPGDVSETFTWREVGIMAKGSESGVETLYAYANSGSQGDIIPGPGSGTVEERVLEFDVIVGNAESVVAEFQSGVYASKEDLDKIQTNVTNITNIIQQVTGVDPDDPDAEPPSGSMVVTLTHSKSGTVHQFTGLEERTGLVPCQFKSTADYTEGDTAIIDGTAYTITLTGADAPETDLFVSGKSILVDVDTESKTINFKAGGGLTNGKLALADATEDTVFNGRTFYARDKTMRTGRALATPITAKTDDVNPGVTYYNERGELMVGTRKKEAKSEIFQMDGTFTVPVGITSVSVRIFGGGGMGRNNRGGGGGHMNYGVFDVTPGQKIPVTIGLGGGQAGNSSVTGGTSSFGTLISAAGGTEADGGSGGGSGNTSFGGGNASYGGGGGGCGYGGYTSNSAGNWNSPGGNGGTYGGGGGSGGYYTSRNNTTGTGGSGGKGGANGGNGGTKGTSGSSGVNTTSLNLEFTGTGSGGKSGSSYSGNYYASGGSGGGGGYGGQGGRGGNAAVYGSSPTSGGGGGGGGYGGAGGKGGNGNNGYNYSSTGGGGGGGYGGAGGAGSFGSSLSGYGGGGGGYGAYGTGGTGTAAGGVAAGGGGNGGIGGNGICIVTYLE